MSNRSISARRLVLRRSSLRLPASPGAAGFAAPPANDGSWHGTADRGGGGRGHGNQQGGDEGGRRACARRQSRGGASRCGFVDGRTGGHGDCSRTVPTFDTVLGVYTGSVVGSLTEVASNDDFGAKTRSRVTFQVCPGTEYRIGGRSRWSEQPFPPSLEAGSGATSSPMLRSWPIHRALSRGPVYGATAEPGD